MFDLPPARTGKTAAFARPISIGVLYSQGGDIEKTVIYEYVTMLGACVLVLIAVHMESIA